MALLRYDLEIGKSYDFRFLAPGILGGGYKNARLLAVLDYGSAERAQDIGAIHAQVLSELPEGTPSNPESLLYLKLKTSAGAEVVIAVDWLSAAPTVVGGTTYVITITGSSPNKLSLISATLRAAGERSFTVEEVA